MMSAFQSDHFVLLLPYKDVINPPSWVTECFKVSPGGRHVDGRTENKLVIFADGTYLELIAFVEDKLEARKDHWWDKPFGIVDFALTSDTDKFDVTTLNTNIDAAGSAVRYRQPIKGGRTRPDGVEMEWKVTFPVTDSVETERGMVPFFCHDLTPRERRVPVSQETSTHPSGAIGVASIRISLKDAAKVVELKKAIYGITSTTSFYVETPIEVKDGSDRGLRPNIQIVQNDDLQVVFQLSLVIALPIGTARKPIEQKIGDGIAHIEFISA